MKVLHIIDGIEQVSGGPSLIVVNLCEALLRQSVEAELVTTQDPFSSYALVDFDAIKQQVRIFDRWKGRIAISFSLQSWLKDNIQQYDVVHIHGTFSYTTHIAATMARQAGIPYIVAPHGLLEPWSLRNKRLKKMLGMKLVVNGDLRSATALHATATPELQNLQQLGLKTPVALVPNGIDRTVFEQLPSPQIFYDQFPTTVGKQLVLFLARIDPKKGLDLLAPAFAKLRQVFPNTHLIVAGPDTIGFLPTVKQYFRDAQCLEAVTFTGNLAGESKFSALAAASVYVAPSYSEGFSISVLEGLAAGLPCVLTTGCNFPEAERANAAYTVDVHADAIAAGLIQCLKELQEGNRRGERARQFIFDYYTWDQAAAQLIQLYQHVVKQRTAA